MNSMNSMNTMHTFYHPGKLGDSQKMSDVLANIKSVFDAPTGNLPEHSIGKVLRIFRQSETLESFLQIKYACFGVGQSIDGWSLFDDEKLFSTLLDQVDDLRSDPRRLRKCYQGLLVGYFGYPLLAEETSKDGHKNFERLRASLNKWLAVVKTVGQATTPVPVWLSTLLAHDNLLHERPCDRYAEELLKGDASDLPEICKALGITRESWVWEKVLLTQVETACSWDDDRFRDAIEQILVTLQADDGTLIAERLAIRCVASMVIRYAKCWSKLEYSALRDAAIGRIGNPWLKRVSWDAYVKTVDGTPDDEARKMISEWLDRRGTGRFTDNGNGTISDNQTGMIWLKEIRSFGQQSWPNAMMDTNNLSSGQCGLRDRSRVGDWHLPTKDVLAGLLDGLSRSALFSIMGIEQQKDDHTDIEIPVNYYWSSTTLAGSSSYAWALVLCDNPKIGCYDQSSSFFVWPVRGKGFDRARR